MTLQLGYFQRQRKQYHLPTYSGLPQAPLQRVSGWRYPVRHCQTFKRMNRGLQKVNNY
jgi:hypothetical protein